MKQNDTIEQNDSPFQEVNMDVKIVTFDIENFSNIVESWQVFGKEWRCINVLVPWSVACFAAKWLGKKTEIYSVDDYEDYEPLIIKNKDGSILLRKPNDYTLMREMHKILDEADIVVGWNSKRFDVKKVQSRMISYGMEPPSPFKQIDVMQEKKKLAASNFNSLNETSAEWGLGAKLEHEGYPLWQGCAEGDPKAWAKMKRYCVQDVILTEKTYMFLRPWMATHPNLNVYTGATRSCPICQRADTLIKRGFSAAGMRRKQIYQCAPSRNGCGKYCTGELIPQAPNEKVIIK